MEDDQEICRVCRCESTPDHPLFHPCKCSGSIRFVHQDCLLEWLSHSKKKYCELCEYPFVFTPIYRDDMPDRIPFTVLFRQCARRCSYFLRTGLRASIVVIVWLVLLPYLTLVVWRLYFWAGESIISAKQLINRNTLISKGALSNETDVLMEEEPLNNATAPLDGSFNDGLRVFLAECFEGQIITAVVIIVFVAAYLFREWVIQNTPADTGLDMLDDNEEIAEEARDREAIQRELVQQQIAAHLEEFERELQLRRQRALRNLRRDGPHDDRRTGESIGSESGSPLLAQERNEQTSQQEMSSAAGDADNGLSSTDTLRSSDEGNRIFSNDRARETSDDTVYGSDIEHDEGGNALTGSNRQSLLANWVEEHDRHDASDEASANLRWRAPEFTNLPDRHDQETGLYHRLQEQIDTGAVNGTESDSGHDEQEPREERPLWAAARPPPQRQPEPARNQWANRNDNREPIAEDDEPFDLGEDIDGVLEAIGMRGNPWMLVQNSMLMFLMISLCLAVAVLIPYVLGRLVILIRPVSFVKTPIYLLQLFIDPLLDFALDYGIPYLRSKIAPVTSVLPENIQVALKTITMSIDGAFGPLLHSRAKSTAGQVESTTSGLFEVAPGNDTFAWGRHIAALQSSIEAAGNAALDRWYRFAVGRSSLDRSVCIFVGYVVLIVAGSFYLGRSRGIPRSRNGSGLNDIIRQQGVFLKVFMFIVLELVIFPAICGILIDLSTLPLFADATVASRWAFFTESPYTSIFLHWFIGTGFMFHFAVFVTLCREIVRPGVMWFIRDPNDPQFHPVQEMIERPVLSLMRKIGSSALMYFILIVAGIGTVAVAVSQFTSVYPLRWPFESPLSTLAIDLLAVQFLVPPLVSHIKPREFSKRILKEWWRAASRQLRLTSFMFNERRPDEEGTFIRRTFKAWILRETVPLDGEVYDDVAIDDRSVDAPVIFKRDGTLARVPKHDSVPVVDNRRMVVPVDPVTLQPIDEEERRLGHPAASDSGDEENNTMIVYIPPRFRLRIIAFLLLMWLSGSALTCSLTVVPLLLGRHIFDMYLAPGTKVHDLYAFIAGAYFMVFLSIIINWIGHKYETVVRSGGRVSWPGVLVQAKEKMKLGLKALYVSLAFGLIIPLLLGIAVDLYIFMPLRYSKTTALVVHISEDWSFGIVYLGIFYGVVNQLPNNRVQRWLNNVLEGGVLRADGWAMTRSTIAPVVAGTACAISTPGLLSLALSRLLGVSDPRVQLAMFRCAYPLAFCLLIFSGFLWLSTKLIRAWLRTIRDDTYLVGKRLHNLDETETPSA